MELIDIVSVLLDYISYIHNFLMFSFQITQLNTHSVIVQLISYWPFSSYYVELYDSYKGISHFYMLHALNVTVDI